MIILSGAFRHNQLPLDGNSLHPPSLAAAYDNDEVKGRARIQIYA
jgi:hypothetical protein